MHKIEIRNCDNTLIGLYQTSKNRSIDVFRRELEFVFYFNMLKHKISAENILNNISIFNQAAENLNIYYLGT